MGGAGSGAVCELNHSQSVTLPLLALPLPPLNFPLTILFKIHGLSYLFFRSDNYNSPEFAKKKKSFKNLIVRHSAVIMFA